MGLYDSLYAISSNNLILFLSVYIVAAYVNHVDDTDETYGYFEPLHYLLYGHGMQTWEYSPAYAIRAYSFLSPFWAFCEAVRGVMVMFGATEMDTKYACYFGVKVLLGTFTAYSQATYVDALASFLGPVTAKAAKILILASPGCFYSATAFLPSSVCANLVLLGAAAWMNGHDMACILYGGVAVMWTGWPFIGLFFFPFGLYMLPKKLYDGGHSPSIIHFFGFLAQVLFVVICLATASIAIDCALYGKLTWPSLNILAYNTSLGERLGWEGPPEGGDTLYGVENMDYYMKNLALTLGLSWVVTVIFFVPMVCWDILYASSEKLAVKVWFSLLRSNDNLDISTLPESPADVGATTRNVLRLELMRRRVLLCAPAMLWLVVMFGRPHKEERFLYPTYGFVVTAAASTLVSLTGSMHRVLADWFSLCKSDACDTGALVDLRDAVPGASTSNKRKPRLQGIFMFLAISAATTVGLSRIISNAYNFSGYRDVWMNLGQRLAATAHAPGSSTTTATTTKSMCVGADWHRAPGHFFLPSSARLAFAKDSFGGQLPQPYPPLWGHVAKSDNSGVGILGTAAPPIQPFNDRNAEEPSRYTPLHACDVLVITVPEFRTHTSVAKEASMKRGRRRPRREDRSEAERSSDLPLSSFLHMKTASKADGVKNPGLLNAALWYWDDPSPSFIDVPDEPIFRAVLNADKSKSFLRAFHIPELSSRLNIFSRYTVLLRTQSSTERKDSTSHRAGNVVGDGDGDGRSDERHDQGQDPGGADEL